MNVKKKETIKRWVAISILIIIISVVVIIMIKYQVNGETNMPFNLSKITIVSTAEGKQNSIADGEENYKWNFNINQSNDLYFFISKNDKYNGQAIIDSASIENIQIIQSPSKGTIKAYMPNSGDGRKFIYDDNFLVKDKLTYQGSKTNNEKTLEIGNQGGSVIIRFANTDIATYKSNDDIEIKHDGSLIEKAGIINEQIKFKIQFDFIIIIDDIKYKANILLELPYNNILESGKSEIEKTDMSDIVFKRIK